MRRWLWLATIVGLTGTVVSGCYRVPQPECGFFCGPSATCPEDYACNATDGRCHRTDTSATMTCSSFIDAGVQDDVPDGGDTLPPFVDTTVPRDRAISVGVAGPITVTFSEDVIGVDDTTLFVMQDVTPVPGVIAYDAISHVATWTPSPTLSSTTTYTANVLSSITDHAGNPLALGRTWTFTTADVIPPTLIATSPINAATGVAITTQVSATFSEHVLVPPTGFNLSYIGGNLNGVTLHYDNVTHIATLTPTHPLPGNTTISASLTAAITDPSGNGFVPQSWTFETGADTVPPSVLSTQPANGSVGVPYATITVNFDEPVIGVDPSSFTVVDQNAMPISGAVSLFVTGSTWRFTPTAGLPGLTTFTVTLTTAITDTAGNHLPAPVTFSFTTG
jgi:hypothetical protein